MNEMNNIIEEHINAKGESPYGNWLNSLKDLKGKARIISHVDRMELDNFGDSEALGDGVVELKIHYGPGYRVYYARNGKRIYLLLCDGNKSTHKKDIKLANVLESTPKRRLKLWVVEMLDKLTISI